MNRAQYRQLMEDKDRVHKEFNISQEEIDNFGEPLEVLQAYTLFFGGKAGAYPQLYPSWARETSPGLKMEFSVDSLTEKKRSYEIPALLKICDYSKQPFIVDFSERVRGKTKQDDINYLQGIKSPGHQEIAIRLWLENFLKKYSEIKQKDGKFNNTYCMGKKYVKSLSTPWYVTGSMDTVAIDEYKQLKKTKVRAADILRTVLERLEDARREV